MRKKKWSKKFSTEWRKEAYGKYVKNGIKNFLGYSFEKFIWRYCVFPITIKK